MKQVCERIQEVTCHLYLLEAAYHKLLQAVVPIWADGQTTVGGWAYRILWDAVFPRKPTGSSE